jgi:hypothetical protein
MYRLCLSSRMQHGGHARSRHHHTNHLNYFHECAFRHKHALSSNSKSTRSRFLAIADLTFLIPLCCLRSCSGATLSGLSAQVAAPPSRRHSACQCGHGRVHAHTHAPSGVSAAGCRCGQEDPGLSRGIQAASSCQCQVGYG